MSFVKMQFVPGRSFVHRSDPILKLIWLVFVSFFVFVLSDPVYMLLVLLYVSAIFVVSRTSFRQAAGMFSLLALLLVIVLAFQVLTNQGRGQVVLELGLGLKVTTAGLYAGILLTSRFATLLMASMVYIFTTDPMDLAVAASHVGVPDRLAFSFILALRFLPMMTEEGTVVRHAQIVRGLTREKGLRGFLDRYAGYVLPLLLVGIRRAVNMGIAMDCRAFSSGKRTFLREFRWSNSGKILLLATVIYFAVILYVDATQGHLLKVQIEHWSW